MKGGVIWGKKDEGENGKKDKRKREEGKWGNERKEQTKKYHEDMSQSLKEVGGSISLNQCFVKGSFRSFAANLFAAS